jgi:NADPH:quinone reductase-like Zn-dependent oxidoreductase
VETSQGKRNQTIASALKKGAVVSGIEMAGTVKSNGRRFKSGDRVFAYTHIFKGPFFHAEYVAVPEKNLAVLPDNATLEGATSIVGGALTAINALERIARLKAGSAILITGATGSVGTAGVQLATHLGAEVSAVCHSSQTDFVLSQGALQAYAYDKGELPPAQQQFDIVFDAAPSLSFTKAKKYMEPAGRYITTMPHLDVGGFATSLFSRRKWGYLMEYKADTPRMERLRTLMSEGTFSSVIDSVYPSNRAKEAFMRQLESGKRGKILLDFRDVE